jgi:hypothetical protein
MESKKPKNLEELFDQYKEEEERFAHYGDLNKMFKEIYSGTLKDLIYKDNPLLKMVKPSKKKIKHSKSRK